jgi:hypothetical protein
MDLVLTAGQLGHLGRGFPMVVRSPTGVLALVQPPDARQNVAREDAERAGLPNLILSAEQMAVLRDAGPGVETRGAKLTTPAHGNAPARVWWIRRAGS